MRYPAKVYGILFFGVLALSSSAIFVRLAQAPSGTLAFYRMLLTAVCILPLLMGSRRERQELRDWERKEWGMAALAGAFLGAHYIIWFESLRFTSVASSIVLVTLQPLFSILFGRLLLKEKTDRAQLLGCVLAIAGSIVIGSGDLRASGQALWGDLLALLAAALIPLYFLIGQVLRRKRSAVTFSGVSYTASALALLLYVLIRGEPLTGFSAGTWWCFVGIAVIATVGGQFVFTLLLRQIPATAVTMSILGEPVGTVILAMIILKEGITLQQLIGMVLILSGLWIANHPAEQKT